MFSIVGLFQGRPSAAAFLFCTSLLQVIDGVTSLALCPQAQRLQLEIVPDKMLAFGFVSFFVNVIITLCCLNGNVFLWEIQAAFPKESQLQQSRATQP